MPHGHGTWQFGGKVLHHWLSRPNGPPAAKVMSKDMGVIQPARQRGRKGYSIYQACLTDRYGVFVCMQSWHQDSNRVKRPLREAKAAPLTVIEQLLAEEEEAAAAAAAQKAKKQEVKAKKQQQLKAQQHSKRSSNSSSGIQKCKSSKNRTTRI